MQRCKYVYFQMYHAQLVPVEEVQRFKYVCTFIVTSTRVVQKVGFGPLYKKLGNLCTIQKYFILEVEVDNY